MTSNNVQTSYPANPGGAYAGQLADSGAIDVQSGIADADIVAGIVCVRDNAGQGVAPPSAAAASATAILASGGTSTGGTQTLTAALNGAVGRTAMVPPRNITFTFSSHSDWDATTATVTGLDADGEALSEDFAIPNGGNATVTGAKLFASVTSVSIPAQSGTGGTFTIGTGTLVGDMTRHVVGASLYDSTKAPGPFSSGNTVPLVRRGRIWLQSESGNPDDPVWVRVSASGAQVLGAVRGSSDGNTCTRLRGAVFRSTTSNGIAVVELNLPR